MIDLLDKKIINRYKKQKIMNVLFLFDICDTKKKNIKIDNLTQL